MFFDKSPFENQVQIFDKYEAQNTCIFEAKNTQHTFTTYPGLGKINRLGLSIFVPKNTFTRFMDLSFGSSSNIIYN